VEIFMTNKVRLSISVDDAHLDRLNEISKAAQKAGLTIEQKLPNLGVLTGSIESAKVGALHGIEGVHSVEEERSVGIAPPGSPVQ
jgi:hypothetical protein